MNRLLACIFTAATLGAAAPGCVGVPQSGKQPVLGTHVQDWRNEVIYQLLVDRFADGDVNNDYNVAPGQLARYQGGDWKGIEDHLDYFDALGVTTLWISPVVRNVETDANVDAYHGYWAQDLTAPNPHFGDLAALRSMIAAAHDRGLKVVLDVVVNHMGQVFFYDMNLNGVPDVNIGGTGCDPNSPATKYGTGSNGQCQSPVTRETEFDPDWDPSGVQAYTSLGPAGRAPLVFINDPSINRVPPKPGILGTARAYHGNGRILNYNDPQQVLLGDFPGGLKDVATEVQEVRDTMVDAYARWAELADFDGFRIDTVKHVEHGFWQAFAPAVRSRLGAEGKGKFFLFGEAFDGDDALLGSFTKNNELDSVVYFSQHYSVYRDVFEYAHDKTLQKGTQQIADLWGKQTTNYATTPPANGIGVPANKALVSFLDNHDVARFLFDAAGDKAALRNALTLLMTEQGIPCLYYGTEQEFAGGNDPSNREVLWQTGFATSGDTFRHFAKLARLRKAYDALRVGDTKVRWSSTHVGTEEDAGVFAFERTGGDAGDKYALVVLNTNDFKTSSTSAGTSVMKIGRTGGTLVDVLDPALATYPVGADGSLKLSPAAQAAMVLVPQEQVVPSP
jgi:glycosidase